MSDSVPRQNVKKGQVYVLKLRADKWYVGFTTKAGTRPEQHAKKRGAKWTKKYVPIDPIPYSMSEPIYTVEDEDKITLALMAEHGIRNVRGGQWCMVDMKAYTVKELEGLIPKSKSKKGAKCSRCGRDSHNRSRCYAVTTIDGVTITSKSWKYRPKAKPKPKTKKAKPKPKTKKAKPKTKAKDVICARCNRVGHASKDCHARTKISPSGPLADMLRRGLPKR